ncbi:MAG: radical SAM protein [Candidatus Hydrogenedentes bacterium]|nr:radical SAM protein [Candidatus Hydrogenedentota bacterium]
MKINVFHVSIVKRKSIALINSNRIHPPISPVGLEYLGETILYRGYNPFLIDLCFENDWQAYLRKRLSEIHPDYIGITFRNLDEAMSSSETSFLPLLKDIVNVCREISQSPIILGGSGYAIAPAEILKYTGANFGLIGNGVNGTATLLECIGNNCVQKCPGAVYRSDEGICVNPLSPLNSEDTQVYNKFYYSRNLANLPKYFAEGGQIGIETKRGCSNKCTYCVESSLEVPISLRNPKSIIHELKSLLNKGIDVFHLCDSEFNLPLHHAKAVCQEIINEGLGNTIKWYAYCTPEVFDEELAELMEKSGCHGINFCVDTIDEEMLDILNKKHNYDTLSLLMKIFRKTKISIMFDLILGAPGETKESAWSTIDKAMELKPDVIGISLGIRLYPHTQITKRLKAQISQLFSERGLIGNLVDNPDLLLPVFYLEPEISNEFIPQLKTLTQSMPNIFLSLPPTEKASYTYCDNTELSEAIKQGARGAYWHILHQLRSKHK